ncbi:calsequestrin-2-like [Pelmatolapia mariae]|uniref:calsequestrin-2-like n=1 Tax=Pelmatolapia mariae TaxID=158779 RepID=UPI002FE550C5
MGYVTALADKSCLGKIFYFLLRCGRLCRSKPEEAEHQPVLKEKKEISSDDEESEPSSGDDDDDDDEDDDDEDDDDDDDD